MAIDITTMLGQLSPDQLAALEAMYKDKFGKPARAKVEKSHELIEAENALAAFEADHALVIEEWQRLEDLVKELGPKRVFKATRQYDLDTESGIITVKGTDEKVTTYGSEGWQKEMKESGYTPGQVAAVVKKMREGKVTA